MFLNSQWSQEQYIKGNKGTRQELISSMLKWIAYNLKKSELCGTPWRTATCIQCKAQVEFIENDPTYGGWAQK